MGRGRGTQKFSIGVKDKVAIMGIKVDFPNAGKEKKEK